MEIQKIQMLSISSQDLLNRPFLSPPGPLFQNEGTCSAFDMKIIFQSHENKTHFHKKGCGTRKWPTYGTVVSVSRSLIPLQVVDLERRTKCVLIYQQTTASRNTVHLRTGFI